MFGTAITARRTNALWTIAFCPACRYPNHTTYYYTIVCTGSPVTRAGGLAHDYDSVKLFLNFGSNRTICCERLVARKADPGLFHFPTAVISQSSSAAATWIAIIVKDFRMSVRQSLYHRGIWMPALLRPALYSVPGMIVLHLNTLAKDKALGRLQSW